MSADFLPPARCDFPTRERENGRFGEKPSKDGHFPFLAWEKSHLAGVENRGSLISVPLALRGFEKGDLLYFYLEFTARSAISCSEGSLQSCGDWLAPSRNRRSSSCAMQGRDPSCERSHWMKRVIWDCSLQSDSGHPFASPLSKNSRNTVYKLRFANVLGQN